MQVAIVHDWLNGMRGGEKVLEELLHVWPDARIYTLFHEPGRVSSRLESAPIVVSPLGRLPGVDRFYRHLLPVFPWAIEALNLGRPDLVISSSHAVAKGARTNGAVHICYCHTPMRYVWDAEVDYSPNVIQKIGLGLFRRRLRSWDAATAERVDHFVANSRFVARRILDYYGRPSTVIYPPVDTGFFVPPRDESDYYLSVGELVGYKRIDVAVDACSRSSRRLIVVGAGPERALLTRRAGPTVTFAGRVAPDELRRLYRGARALIVPAREDFGIAAVEARCCGCPVVAFAESGTAETLVDGSSALLFHRQDAGVLKDALDRFERMEWDPALVRQGTEKFSRERFRTEISDFVRARG